MTGRLTREDARNVRVEVLLTAAAADFANNIVATAKIAELTATNAAAQQERQNQIGGTGDMRQDYRIYADAFDAMLADMETVRDFAIPYHARFPDSKTNSASRAPAAKVPKSPPPSSSSTMPNRSNNHS